ncbi:MAG: N-formylglutamate amidohydrolase [Geminicoccaceae bacterium]
MQHGPLAPYLIVAPRGLPLPLVLSSPHSGVAYPEDMLAQSRLTQRQLRALDDGPVDALLAAGCAAGATLIAATYPRAVVDLNRDATEQDPDSLADPERMPGLRVTARARAGLGVVPTRLLGQPIYAARLHALEVHRRLVRAYQPYHAQLAALAAERRCHNGVSLVLDCHSMPTVVSGRGERAIDVALGDRFGRSCHQHLIEVAESVLARAGLSVARNRPYAGGYITEHHGRPAAASHALQLELRRGLFMHESTHEPNDGFEGLRALLGELVRALADATLELATPEVAGRRAALRSA